MTSAAIHVEEVWKAFRLYHERNQSLKQTVMRRRRVRFDQFWALRDVSFEVPKGSTFGIVGSNGSGKSTTLKVLAGILQPDSGNVRIQGRLAALLELGAGFHPELTGRENIFLNGSLLGLRRVELAQRFDEIVDFSGLRQFIDNPVKTYSSGMYARLGFSVAINVDPEVLLIDEVLAVGDEDFQERCYERISRLQSSGKTVLIVSHGLPLVRQLCDQAAWIEKGVVRAIGPADDVVGAYIDEAHTAGAPRGGWHGEDELTVERVQVVGEGPGDDATVRARSPFRIEIDWSATGAPCTLGATLTVRRIDGVVLATVRSGPLRPVTGRRSSGTLVYSGPRLSLVPGVYEIDLKVTEIDGVRVHGEWARATRFDVAASELAGVTLAHGLVDLGGTWTES